MIKVFTKARSHNSAMNFGCALCGNSHEQKMACVELHEIDAAGEDDVFGDVCPECVQAGPQGAAERTLHYSKLLKQQAEQLEWLAGRVAAIDREDWATLSDLVRCELNVEAYFQDVPEGERDGWIEQRVAKRVAAYQNWLSVVGG